MSVGSMIALDHWIFLWLNELLSGSIATWFFGGVTWLGNGLVLALLIVPAMAKWDRRALRRHLLPMVVAVAVTGAAVNVAKWVLGRERPPLWALAQGLEIHVPFGIPTDKSFPSGHAQTAFGTAVYLALLYPKAAPVLLVLALLVGISRVALGVHFPGDVVVGAFLGSFGSLMAHLWTVRRANRLARHQDSGGTTQQTR
jgi:undecaprenyl-diphosphatase